MRKIDILKRPLNLQIHVPNEMVAEFKLMAQRAINTWQDASPEMRDFIDRLLERDHLVLKPKPTVTIGASLLREPIKSAADLPVGCYCAPGKCGAPYADWCRDAVKRDAMPVGQKVEVNVPVPKDTTLATRSCCGTLLREPHHTECKERWSQAPKRG